MKNAIKTTILLAAMTGVILVSGDLLGGKVGLLVALGIATLVNFVAYWHSDKIVLRTYRARAATKTEAPKLHQLVRELCTAVDLPMPGCTSSIAIRPMHLPPDAIPIVSVNLHDSAVYSFCGNTLTLLG